MNKKKIFNDPVYGFVSIPYGIVFDLIEHPYFQRLRRIKQVGLTHYVYPGALHTRFHHALGAMHLMTQAIDVLRSKGIDITEAEAKAASIAILLHDIGHGPFSHALEHTLVNIHHEELSLLFMEALNEEFDGQLSMAIRIFQDEYPKRFLHQLVSSQLDMDRMDYLNRDSFFTGVSEGVIGYDRIIKMLSVSEDELVVEEKGIYSIEKFLMARRLMYWQVYLHKTSLVAEQMLIRALKRAKAMAKAKNQLVSSPSLSCFLYEDFQPADFRQNPNELLGHYANLDDTDIISLFKSNRQNEDFVLSYLSKSILDRRLFKIVLSNSPFERDHIEKVRHKLVSVFGQENLNGDYILFEGKESNSAYSTHKNEIRILYKDGRILPMSKASDHKINPEIITKYYLCYPKNIL
ncbi:MAG: HD domain-containing protein [Bacteroidota bacterium]